MITIKCFEKENLKIHKVMAVSRKDQLEKIDLAKRAIEGKFEISMASSHPHNVEFTSIEANKGTALLRYQQLVNLHFDEIFAFGDGGNDLSPSLKWRPHPLQWATPLSLFNRKQILSPRRMTRMALPTLSDSY